MQSPNTTINLYTWHKSKESVFCRSSRFKLNLQSHRTKDFWKTIWRSDQLIWFGTGLLKFSHSVCLWIKQYGSFFLIKCGSFEEKLHLFFPSEKSGLQKSYLMMVFLVGRSSTKTLRLWPHFDVVLCGHLVYQPTSAVVTCLLALQHLAKTHLRCLAGPANKQTIGRSCCMQQASTNGFKKWLLPHVAYHFPHYWWCLWCYCGTNNLNSDPSKTNKQTSNNFGNHIAVYVFHSWYLSILKWVEVQWSGASPPPPSSTTTSQA